MTDNYNVEHTSREVIEGKLLAALDDDEESGYVAILASEEDINLLIRGLVMLRTTPHMESLLAGLRKLKEEAFDN